MANFHRWLDRVQVRERKLRPSSIYLLLLVTVAFTLGVLSYDVWTEANQPVVKSNTEAIEKLSKQLNNQAQVLASRNLELALAEETNDEMQGLFAKQHIKEQELVRELAFYRSIMAPENNADGVAIHGLELSENLLPDHYRLKLILTQLQKRKQSLKGRAEFTFIGLQDGQFVELSLESVSVDKQLAFQFRYFQVLESEVTFPVGFELSRVIAKVNVPSSRWTKGSQAEMEFPASELLPVTEPISAEEVIVEDIEAEIEVKPGQSLPSIQQVTTPDEALATEVNQTDVATQSNDSLDKGQDKPIQ
ncbi:DUF6776 family protein [Shewanella sp. UCD-KL12]|uniref:DUF6776 family protein n=1 Tax=Shewanella sp. UCD-KL12 TaxID=1917163 RepID=UPI0009704A41|nr:DUF6776 family protein [Shewanella sp. UCD-KL12]